MYSLYMTSGSFTAVFRSFGVIFNILNVYVEKYDFDFQIKKMSPYHLNLELVQP